jgi:inorganic pyrophosphatase
MHIITSGFRYIDIDAYGGCVAYAELLNLQGIAARAVSTAPANASVPPLVTGGRELIDRTYKPTPQDTFAILDISDPEFFDTIVELERITEVIDHHPGFEDFWRKRWGHAADIEFTGAVCTMIYKRWAKAGLAEHMRPGTARLLACGILDNTLNFKATIASDRDHQAYQALAKLADLPADWPAQYFSACQALIESNLAAAIRNDSKTLTFTGRPTVIGTGQLAIWDAPGFIQRALPAIAQAMPTVASPWFMSVISINEGKNYILCEDPDTQAWLADLLETTFSGNIAHTNRLWLRKEIIKQAIDKEGKHEAN